MDYSALINLWQVIRNHPSALEIYKKKVLESGEMSKEDVDEIQKKVMTILNQEFEASKDYVPQRRDWLSAYWQGFKSPEQLSRIRNTGYLWFNMSDLHCFDLWSQLILNIDGFVQG